MQERRDQDPSLFSRLRYQLSTPQGASFPSPFCRSAAYILLSNHTQHHLAAAQWPLASLAAPSAAAAALST